MDALAGEVPDDVSVRPPSVRVPSRAASAAAAGDALRARTCSPDAQDRWEDKAQSV